MNRDAAGNRKKGFKWLWLLVPLILLGLLGYGLHEKSEDNDSKNTAATSSQSADDQKSTQASNNNTADMNEQKYDAQFNAEAKAVYFNADTTEITDEAATAAKLDAILAFAKQYHEAKFQVNGSIFDSQQADSASTLAKQRAELIKTRLTDSGFKSDMITISTINNYEGKDDAAKAMYARSVVVTVTN